VSSGRRRAGRIAALALPLAICLPLVPAAHAQDVPSVSVRPADTGADDPNGGQWFALELEPGETGSATARILNPAGVAQRVVLYTRDLTFSEEGTPNVREGEQQGLGSWGTAPQTLLLGPGESVLHTVSVTAPADADPGDHVGVLVAETSNRQDGQSVVRRIATRFYVTLPGAATRAMSIGDVDQQVDSRWFPQQVSTEVTLDNVGRVRLRPTVRVGDDIARGAQTLMSQSSERYQATTGVPWYGGVLRMPVQAVDDTGLARSVDQRLIVVPWGLLLGLAGAGLVVWRLRGWWRRRSSRLDSLHSDVRRLERLLAQTLTAAARPSEDVSGLAEEARAQDQVHELLVAAKRAERAGAYDSLGRLALALHAVQGPALPVLVDALPHQSEADLPEVQAAILSYDPDLVARQLQARGLSPELLGESPADVTEEQRPAQEPTPAAPPAGAASQTAAGKKAPGKKAAPRSSTTQTPAAKKAGTRTAATKGAGSTSTANTSTAPAGKAAAGRPAVPAQRVARPAGAPAPRRR
jgi:hypothetical protein